MEKFNQFCKVLLILLAVALAIFFLLIPIFGAVTVLIGGLALTFANDWDNKIIICIHEAMSKYVFASVIGVLALTVAQVFISVKLNICGC